MPIFKGSVNQGLIHKGSSVITNIYKGSTLVYRLGFDPVTFTASGTWTVPTGIRQIRVDCVAGQGRSLNATALGGNGGRVQCVLFVTPNQTLKLKVGKQYLEHTDNRNDSLISFTENDLDAVVQAGGGGSASNPVWIRAKNVVGGHGGGLVGGQGTVNAPGGVLSGGGTQTSGGVGPYFNQANIKGIDYRTQGTGGRLTGGAPYIEADQSVGGYRSGCGGAGYYGGGGGLTSYFYVSPSQCETYAIGGGGGSSYTHPDLCSEVIHTQGYRAGSGYITISMV